MNPNNLIHLSDTTLNALHFELARVEAGWTVSYPFTANAEFVRRLHEELALKGLRGRVTLVRREPGRVRL